MTKKNYYELLGVKQKDEPAQIFKTFWKLVKKLHCDNDINNEEKKEKFKEINEAYIVLTDFHEKERYDSCNEKENFHTNIEIIEVVKWDAKTPEQEIKELEKEKLRMFNKKEEYLKELAKTNKEWKCSLCRRPHEKLIIYSEENLDPKLCFACFVYVEGRTSGEKNYELRGQSVVYALKVIKKIEEEWESAIPFSLISFLKIAKIIEEEKK